MKVLRSIWLHRLLGVALGAVFLWASHDKIADPRPLVTIIWGYQLIPPGPANLVVIFMPWMELLVGLGLLTGYKRRAAAGWASFLLLTFVLALTIDAFRGISVACGCFSTSAEDIHSSWLLVARDLPMLAAALVLLVAPPRRREG